MAVNEDVALELVVADRASRDQRQHVRKTLEGLGIVDANGLIDRMQGAGSGPTSEATVAFTAQHTLRVTCKTCKGLIDRTRLAQDDEVLEGLVRAAPLFCRHCGELLLKGPQAIVRRKFRFATDDAPSGLWEADPATGLPGTLARPWRLVLRADRGLVVGPVDRGQGWRLERHYALVGAAPARLAVQVDEPDQPGPLVLERRRGVLQAGRTPPRRLSELRRLPWRHEVGLMDGDPPHPVANEGVHRLKVWMSTPAFEVEQVIEVVTVRAEVSWPAEVAVDGARVRCVRDRPEGWSLRLKEHTHADLRAQATADLKREELSLHLVGVGPASIPLGLGWDDEKQQWNITLVGDPLPAGRWKDCRLQLGWGQHRVVVEEFQLGVISAPNIGWQDPKEPGVVVASAPRQDDDPAHVSRVSVLASGKESVDVTLLDLAAGADPVLPARQMTVVSAASPLAKVTFHHAGLLEDSVVHLELIALSSGYFCDPAGTVPASGSGVTLLRGGAVGSGVAVYVRLTIGNDAIAKKFEVVEVRLLDPDGALVADGRGAFSKPLPLVWRRPCDEGPIELRLEVVAASHNLGRMEEFRARVVAKSEWQLLALPDRVLASGAVQSDHAAIGPLPVRMLAPAPTASQLRFQHRAGPGGEWVRVTLTGDLVVRANLLPFVDTRITWAVDRSPLGCRDLDVVAAPHRLNAGPGVQDVCAMVEREVDGIRVSLDDRSSGRFGLRWSLSPQVLKEAGINSAVLRAYTREGKEWSVGADATVSYEVENKRTDFEPVKHGGDLRLSEQPQHIRESLQFEVDAAAGPNSPRVEVDLEVRYRPPPPVVLWTDGWDRLPDLGGGSINLSAVLNGAETAAKDDRYQSPTWDDLPMPDLHGRARLGGARDKAWWEALDLPERARDGEWTWIPVLLGNRDERDLRITAAPAEADKGWLEVGLVSLPVPVALEGRSSLPADLWEKLRAGASSVILKGRHWTTCVIGVRAPVRPLIKEGKRPWRGRLLLKATPLDGEDRALLDREVEVSWPAAPGWSERDQALCLDLGTSTLRALVDPPKAQHADLVRRVSFMSPLAQAAGELAPSTLWVPEVKREGQSPSLCAVGDWAVSTYDGPVSLDARGRWGSLLFAMKAAFSSSPEGSSFVEAAIEADGSPSLRRLSRWRPGVDRSDPAEALRRRPVRHDEAVRVLVRHALERAFPDLTDLPERLRVSYPAVFSWEVFLRYRAMILDGLVGHVERRLRWQVAAGHLELSGEVGPVPEEVKGWVNLRLAEEVQQRWWEELGRLGGEDRILRVLATGLTDPRDPREADVVVSGPILGWCGLDAAAWSRLRRRFRVRLITEVDEATAVAIHWFADRLHHEPTFSPADGEVTRVCVHDLGGGTYDVAVVDLTFGMVNGRYTVKVVIQGTTGSLYAGEHATGVVEGLLLEAAARHTRPSPPVAGPWSGGTTRSDDGAVADGGGAPSWTGADEVDAEVDGPDDDRTEPGDGATGVEPAVDRRAPAGGLPGPEPERPPPTPPVEEVGPQEVSAWYLWRRGSIRRRNVRDNRGAIRIVAERVKRTWIDSLKVAGAAAQPGGVGSGGVAGEVPPVLPFAVGLPPEDRALMAKVLLDAPDALSLDALSISRAELEDWLDRGYRENIRRAQQLIDRVAAKESPAREVHHVVSGQAGAEPRWLALIAQTWPAERVHRLTDSHACARGLLAIEQAFRRGSDERRPILEVETASWRVCPATVRVVGIPEPFYQPGDDWGADSKEPQSGVVDDHHPLAEGVITLTADHDGGEGLVFYRYEVEEPDRPEGPGPWEVRVKISQSGGGDPEVRWQIQSVSPKVAWVGEGQSARRVWGPNHLALVSRDAYEQQNPSASWCASGPA